MKSRMLSVFILFIVVLTGCSKDEQSVVKKIPVKIYKVKSESISKYIRVTGSVSGDEDVVLYSKVPEHVKAVYVVPGQKVYKDQILVEQKNDMLRQGMDIASAALKTAESHAKMTATDFDRMSKLYSERAISPQQYDQSRTAKEAAEHSLEQSKSMYEQAKEQFENSQTKSPFDGVAVAVFVEKNQMLNVGQSVVQVVSPARMKSKVYLTGDDIQYVKVGQRVQIKFPVIPDTVFLGRVDKRNTAVDQTTRAMEVEIGFISKDKRIKSGIFGEFFIETQNIPNALIIPEQALISQTEIKIDRETGLQKTLKKFYLFVVKNEKAIMREVNTGIANNGQIQIRNGINEGDSVVVVGQNIVKDSAAVRVIE